MFELMVFRFLILKRAPQGQLHSALPDFPNHAQKPCTIREVLQMLGSWAPLLHSLILKRAASNRFLCFVTP